MQLGKVIQNGGYQTTSLDKVKEFWESNPLWSGESKYELGTLEFFEEHRKIIENDCFAGKRDERVFRVQKHKKILDLGCGIGMWITEFGLRGFTNLHAVDLTLNAIDLTEKRLKSHDLNAELSVQNAENTSFQDTSFDHINCQGVIHHTPNTASCVREIARILNKDGTAVISVYHRNIFLRLWPLLRSLGILLSSCGAKLSGRGREDIFKQGNVNEIVRLYDGSENPIGKSHTKKTFLSLLSPYFHVEETYLHFFPARSLPFAIPKIFHRFLDRWFGLMIYATSRKKCVE